MKFSRCFQFVTFITLLGENTTLLVVTFILTKTLVELNSNEPLANDIFQEVFYYLRGRTFAVIKLFAEIRYRFVCLGQLLTSSTSLY